MATRKKAAPAPDPEEVEDEDLELEELDEAVEEEKPAKKTGRKKRADAPAFGIQELCALLEAKTGKAYNPREVRTQLRKMAREENARINREITPENRQRYSWTGPDDPEVLAVIAAVTGGEIEKSKKEALDALKERKAKKDAAEGKAKAPAKKAAAKKKAAPAPDPDEDDEELEDDDED